jgi:hypothetical protein
MNTTNFTKYAAAIRNFNGDPLTTSLHMASEGRLSVFYSPTEWVNPQAKIVIIGITPGPTQAANALAEAQRQMRAGASVEDTLKNAKLIGGFSGELRTNLVDMLDHVGIPRWARITSSAELFGHRSDLVQLASVLPYPVFVDGNTPYKGSPKLQRSPLLRSLVLEHFLPSIQANPQARLLAVGDVPFETLKWLAEQGHLDPKRILGNLPHPSGASAERIKYFLGRKPAAQLSAKTNAAKLDQMRHHLLQTLAA